MTNRRTPPIPAPMKTMRYLMSGASKRFARCPRLCGQCVSVGQGRPCPTQDSPVRETSSASACVPRACQPAPQIEYILARGQKHSALEEVVPRQAWRGQPVSISVVILGLQNLPRVNVGHAVVRVAARDTDVAAFENQAVPGNLLSRHDSPAIEVLPEAAQRQSRPSQHPFDPSARVFAVGLGALAEDVVEVHAALRQIPYVLLNPPIELPAAVQGIEQRHARHLVAQAVSIDLRGSGVVTA